MIVPQRLAGKFEHVSPDPLGQAQPALAGYSTAAALRRALKSSPSGRSHASSGRRVTYDPSGSGLLSQQGWGAFRLSHWLLRGD